MQNKDNTVTNQRIKRNIKEPSRFLTTSSDDAPRKRLIKMKNEKIEEDIRELENVFNEEDNNDSTTEYSETQHLSQCTSEKITLTQSEIFSNNSNVGHVTQSAPNNIIPSYSQIPYQHIPSQMIANTASLYALPSIFISQNPSTSHSTPQNHCISQNPSTSHSTPQNHCISQNSSTLHPTPQNHFIPQNSSTSHPTPQNISHSSLVPLSTPPCKQENTQNNNTHMQYDEKVSFWPQQDNNLPSHLSSNTYINTDTRVALQPINYNDNRLYERLDNLNEQIRRLFDLVQNALKSNKKSKRPLTKPSVLPIMSMEQMEAFEHVEEDIYLSVVHYLAFLGGFHIKETINTCLKEAIQDSLTSRFTWYGNDHQKSFSQTRLVRAIFEATCNNVNFPSPTRLEFQKHMKEALRTAKERNRSRSVRRNNQQTVSIDQNNRAYWNDNSKSINNTENTEPSTDK